MALKTVNIEVELELTEQMLGTVPKDREVYSTYIESKRPPDVEGPPEVDDIEEVEERGWTGFHADQHGLYVFDYFIKGFMKNAANLLKDQLAKKNLRSKIADFVFVEPRKIYLGKAIPDGMLERPLRAMTQQGPRVTLARSDVVCAGTRLSFTLRMLPHKEITPELLATLFEYGEFQGLGQNRGGGYGKFKVVKWQVQE